MRLKPSELKQLGPRALAQLHAQGIDITGDVPDEIAPKPKRSNRPVRRGPDLSGLSSFDGETLLLVIPVPPGILHPNARGHYMARGRATKSYRAVCRATVLEALCGRPAPAWAYAIEQTTWYARTKARSDSDGKLSNLKSAYDSLQDSRIVDNDAGLTHEPVVMEWDRDRPRVQIRVRERQ